MTKKSSNDQIGYGTPPTESQFKPGKSGNPKGRPKGARSFEAMIQKELQRKSVVQTPTGPKEMQRRELLARQVVNGAAAGKRAQLDAVVRLDNAWQEKEAKAAEANRRVPDYRWLAGEAMYRMPMCVYMRYTEGVKALDIIFDDMEKKPARINSGDFPVVIRDAISLAFNEALMLYEDSEEAKLPGAWRFPWAALEASNAKITREANRKAVKKYKENPPDSLDVRARRLLTKPPGRVFTVKAGKHAVDIPLDTPNFGEDDEP